MTSKDDGETPVNITVTELKPPTTDWSLEDVPKEFTAFKTTAKMWLETNGIPDYKQYMCKLQLLGKAGFCN